MERVVLVGLRCSGKTTVGELLAERLGWGFLDSDDEIVRRAGRPIREIFEKEGEPVFRRIESEVIKDLCSRERLVLATGGGAVMDPSNVEAMRKDALVVHLDAGPEVLWERMKRDPATFEQRPALTEEGGLAEMQEIARRRAELYAKARHIALDSGRLGPDELAGRIVEELLEGGGNGGAKGEPA